MIRRAAIRYRDFLRLPDVATMLVVALVTRMPIGTLSLSMLLHVRARAGSFALRDQAVAVSCEWLPPSGIARNRREDRRDMAPTAARIRAPAIPKNAAQLRPC